MRVFAGIVGFCLGWLVCDAGYQDHLAEIEESAAEIGALLVERTEERDTLREAVGAVQVRHFEVTAYTANECEPWCDGLTASMKRPVQGRTIACPRELPFGTHVLIPGVGAFRCEDRGGAIKGNRIDIYFHRVADALDFGRRRLRGVVMGDS